MENIATVAIIGRPNVGKSSLFNCLSGEQKSIISDIPNTTRDNIVSTIHGEKLSFLLVDTAGLTDIKGEDLETKIQKQASISLENADLILFIVDGKSELTSDDFRLAEILRKKSAKIIFCANKIDDKNVKNWDFLKIGLGEPNIISVNNFIGIHELVDDIENKLKTFGFCEKSEIKEDNTKVAFVGRPNVGKSSLLNKLLNEEKSLVSDIPGTTRDTVNAKISVNDEDFVLLDTAGIRRPGKIAKDFEFWSSVRTRRAIETADVCVLILDALAGVTHQDLVIAGKVLEAGKGLLIGVNKFDLAIEKSRAKEESDEREVEEIPMWDERLDKIREKYLKYLTIKMKFLPDSPVLFFSAKTGKGLNNILENCQKVAEERNKRITTAELNKYLPEIFYGHVAPSVGTKQGKLKFVSQVDNSPPKFLFSVNNTKAFHFSYHRYLENKIREKYGFHGTPIVIELRDYMDNEKRKR